MTVTGRGGLEKEQPLARQCPSFELPLHPAASAEPLGCAPGSQVVADVALGLLAFPSWQILTESAPWLHLHAFPSGSTAGVTPSSWPHVLNEGE